MSWDAGKKVIGLGLGVALTLLVITSVMQGSVASTAVIPSQSQYTTPTNTTGLTTADYGVIGIVIALIVAGLLYYVLFMRNGGQKPTTGKDGEENEDVDSKDTSSKDYDEDAADK